MGSQKGTRIEQPKVLPRSVNSPVGEQFARPTRRVNDPVNSRKKNEGDLDGKKKELQEKIESDGVLINSLQSEVLELKAELDKVNRLNIELQFNNKKLSEDLAAAEEKITALTTRDQVRIYKPMFDYCEFCKISFAFVTFMLHTHIILHLKCWLISKEV